MGHVASGDRRERTRRSEARIARKPAFCIAALDDQQHCAAAADGSILIFDATTGRRVATLGRPSSDPLRTLRASHDRRLLVSTDAVHSCDVWDIASRRHLARFTFDSSSLICDIDGSTGTLVAGLAGLARDVAFLRLRDSR